MWEITVIHVISVLITGIFLFAFLLNLCGFIEVRHIKRRKGKKRKAQKKLQIIFSFSYVLILCGVIFLCFIMIEKRIRGAM